MQELLRKSVELEIPLGKKKFNFIIKQANLEETLEFDFYKQKGVKEITKYIFEMLHKINQNFTFEYFNKISPENYLKIHDFIIANYCKGFYEVVKKGVNKEKTTENRPFSATVASIISNSNETMESLLKLTWEQIVYLSEGILFNMNEETKEGKAENAKKMVKKEIEEGKYKDVLEKLKANREKINEKFINNKK